VDTANSCARSGSGDIPGRPGFDQREKQVNGQDDHDETEEEYQNSPVKFLPVRVADAKECRQIAMFFTLREFWMVGAAPETSAALTAAIGRPKYCTKQKPLPKSLADRTANIMGLAVGAFHTVTPHRFDEQVVQNVGSRILTVISSKFTHNMTRITRI